MASRLGYSYFDPTHPTNRVGAISYPNGQSTDFNYFGITGDERLEEIKNLNPSSAVLSQDDYTYDADGKIATWQEPRQIRELTHCLHSSFPLKCVARGFFFYRNSQELLLPFMWEDAIL